MIFQTVATPVFVDVLPDVLTLDPKDLAAKITPRSKAVMVVDVFGHPAEWDEILAVTEAAGLAVVDDSCEALGATYKGRELGSFGDAASFAFYPNKQITTGEGGVLVTDREDVAETARSLRNQGRDAMGTWLSHVRLGYNYRMDEMSAALGVSQMKRLDDIMERRAAVAASYDRALAGIAGVTTPVVHDHVTMSWFVYVVRLAPPEKGGVDRDAALAFLEEQGVPCRAYFSPIHTQPYVRERLGDLAGTLPRTEEISRQTMALPFHTNLSDEEVARVAEALRAAVA